MLLNLIYSIVVLGAKGLGKFEVTCNNDYIHIIISLSIGAVGAYTYDPILRSTLSNTVKLGQRLDFFFPSAKEIY